LTYREGGYLGGGGGTPMPEGGIMGGSYPQFIPLPLLVTNRHNDGGDKIVKLWG
jgi:hypothetical protein